MQIYSIEHWGRLEKSLRVSALVNDNGKKLCTVSTAYKINAVKSIYKNKTVKITAIIYVDPNIWSTILQLCYRHQWNSKIYKSVHLQSRPSITPWAHKHARLLFLAVWWISSSGWDASFSASQGADGRIRGEEPFPPGMREHIFLYLSSKRVFIFVWADEPLRVFNGFLTLRLHGEAAHLSPKRLAF